MSGRAHNLVGPRRSTHPNKLTGLGLRLRRFVPDMTTNDISLGQS